MECVQVLHGPQSRGVHHGVGSAGGCRSVLLCRGDHQLRATGGQRWLQRVHSSAGTLRLPCSLGDAAVVLFLGRVHGSRGCATVVAPFNRGGSGGADVALDAELFSARFSKDSNNEPKWAGPLLPEVLAVQAPTVPSLFRMWAVHFEDGSSLCVGGQLRRCL